ncbi:hypothetical protein H7849_12910 [Alloacidobacterium dinghuense]|uniref:Uncharacterized protein n=2 Tax=Alloacidobacterium dinghuense TaxID=2763107 RepID=A0A7G8BQZ5_9BACT|nr:hypothetical protein H7849_12910 [Alloacidobacterium dinghuense]
MMVFLPLFIIIGSLIVVIPYWMIFKKAGFPPFLGILMVVPIVNLVLLYVLAFSPWKVMPPNPNAYPVPNYPPQI